jgi:hypothetical protein
MLNQPIPGHISGREFKKMLSGNNRYLPKKVTDQLKSSGFKHLLYKNKISKEQALKAVKSLQDSEAVSRFKMPSQLYREAGIRQRDFDEAQRQAEIKKHARVNIKRDIENEAAALERGETLLPHDKRSVLGKSVYEELTEEQQARDKKIKDQLDKKSAKGGSLPVRQAGAAGGEKFDNKNSGPASRPELADLPNMEID